MGKIEMSLNKTMYQITLTELITYYNMQVYFWFFLRLLKEGGRAKKSPILRSVTHILE